MKLYLSQLESPLGTLLCLTDAQQAVSSLQFADSKTRPFHGIRKLYGQLELVNSPPPADIANGLSRYFRGDLDVLKTLRTSTPGSELQRRVWATLCRIPVGTTTTYGKIARELGFEDPRAAIDVGAVIGANPIGIIVPCHRVIGSDGSLKGYAWGVQRKRWLLEHEKAIARKDNGPQMAIRPGA